jgi:glycine cleavage system aminomethyltransferase T
VNAAEALRTSAAFSMQGHVTAVRVSGSRAFAAIDRICPRKLFLRDGQMIHTLLLQADARPLADLYICADDQDFILLAEGITAPALTELLTAPGADVQVNDLAETHGLVSLDGPYAWEVFAELAGPEVIGQPYMTFFHSDELTAFRAGKTGEFGYTLMVPADRVDPLRATLIDRGAPFDIAEADLAALDQCALENWYFNIRREGLADASPIELQLQWRVSAGKEFTGAAALAERRARATQRLLLCAGPTELAIGDRVVHGATEIGTVINAGFSSVRGDWVASALVDRPYSHPRIRAYEIVHGSARVPIETLAAPALDNRSLYVNPQQHSYQTRNEVQFPPVVPRRT